MVDAVPTTREALLDRIERRAPQQRWIVADRNELGPYFSLCHLIDVPLETVRALLGPDDWFRAETTSQPNQWMFRVARADGLRLACLGNFQHVVWIYIDHSGAAPLTQPGHMIDKSNPLLAWDNISDKGKWSILGFIGLLEVLGEAEKPHYMRGGKSGTHDLVWYFGSKYLSGKTEEQKLRSRTAEINNGRLAMIGIMGFIAASTVPGSVPYFTEDLTQYSGSVWAPF